MHTVAILTPAPSDATYAAAWPIVLARLVEALATAGVTATTTPWTDHVDDASALQCHALVLPLLAWGYHRDHARWLHACATWQAAGVRIANPADVLAWNSDKRYLQVLADRGIAIPATTWCDAVTASDIASAFAATDAPQLIIKPTVSGGAWLTQRLARGDAIGALPDGAAMIQPYLSTIEREGETSFLYFGSTLSHVVNKRPMPGEFRIQQQYGGQYTAVATPAPAARALADRVIAAIGVPLLYARIDVVPDAQGHWLLMEAELIEPDLYLGVDAGAGVRFAEALLAVLRAIPAAGAQAPGVS